MKLFMGVVFAALALNGVFSLPARTEDAEVIGGPRRALTRADAADDDDDDFTNFKGVIDTGSGYPFLQPNPSVIHVGFFDSFDDLFRRFSERLFPSSFFGKPVRDSDEDDSGELGIPAIDPKKANSTSTVKVVDGHKVEVNETVYGDANSLFKVRVVNIRPLEEGETVEETETKDIKPVTQGPEQKAADSESSESNETREPLDKKPAENEIKGNIDEPEHSIAKKENIVETAGETAITTTTTIATTIDTTMLPTTEDLNAAFVTDNSLEQEVEEAAGAAAAAEELNGDNGNGNNEFETNMSEENSNSNGNNNADNNIDNVENLQVEHTIENNEDTEEEVNDNLNESSSSSSNAADVFDNKQENNNNDDDDDVDGDVDVVDNAGTGAGAGANIEIVNLQKKNSNYIAAIRKREREDESSSDDEDAIVTAGFVMHPTFNDEWGSLNEPTNEQNDFSNDIDAYDVLPIDLSNDIAVNDAANLPINPDAEFIDVYGVPHASNAMPKFEKLSLDK